jgi:dGTPase
MDRILPSGFSHNAQSIRVVERLENGGEGLNLTWEVLDGILNHRTSGSPGTMEGQVVQIADKIAYINHDIDDALRAEVLSQNDLPKAPLVELGSTSSRRIDFLIRNVIEASAGKDKISMSPNARESMGELRDFLFATVYESQLQQKEREKIRHVLHELYFHYLNHLDQLPCEYAKMIEGNESPQQISGDFVAGMTDRYAIKTFSEIFVPSSWHW